MPPDHRHPQADLRQGHAGDAETFALVGAGTFLDAYAGKLDGRDLLAFCREHHTVPAWQALLDDAANSAWLAEIEPGAAPIGYAAMLGSPEMPPALVQPHDRELKRIYVLSRFYGAGVAQQLMRQVVTSARTGGGRRLLVGLHRGNLRAMAFYQRQGFREVGLRHFTVGACCFEDPVLALDL